MNDKRKTGPANEETPAPAARADARAWVLRFASGDSDPAADPAFRAWLAAADSNRQAYAEASGLWDGLADVDGIEDLLTDRDNLTAFRTRAVSRRIFAGGAIAAALACAAGLGLTLMQPAPSEPVFLQTQNGQIETFTLSDGSTITLGGASRISGTLTAKERHLELVSGNAFFDIAHDESRPLTVAAGGYDVRVLGTSFDIRKHDDWVSVSVARGHVRIADKAGDHRQDLLAGDKIVASLSDGLGAVQAFDQERELSWRSGRLSFVDAPLRDIVADMNQYSDRPIRLSADAPSNLRLTLSFRVDQVDKVLAGLDTGYPLQIESTADGTLISGEH